MSDGLYAYPGETKYAMLEWSVTGLVGTMNFKIRRDSDGSVVYGPTTSGITEPDPGKYKCQFVAPTTSGEYTVIWNNGGSTPLSYATEDLNVTSSQLVAASGLNLCSLAQVKSRAKITHTNDDTLISDLITMASERIEEYTHRYLSDHGTSTKKFKVKPGQRLIDLDPYDLRTPTTVTMDPAGTPTVLTNYVLLPLNGSQGMATYYQLNLGLSVSSSSSDMGEFGFTQLSIAGSWGPAATPMRVVHAAVTTVCSWRDRALSEFSSNFEASEDGRAISPDLMATFEIPWDAKKVLNPFRRVAVK